ncbi:hypothetical protein MP638_001117 [Amoeboaphelidium occidentale]|nr:hypothetical protein MP638_001117 [Amoeboaphelidium occidentale]
MNQSSSLLQKLSLSKNPSTTSTEKEELRHQLKPSHPLQSFTPFTNSEITRNVVGEMVSGSGLVMRNRMEAFHLLGGGGGSGSGCGFSSSSMNELYRDLLFGSDDLLPLEEQLQYYPSASNDVDVDTATATATTEDSITF